MPAVGEHGEAESIVWPVGFEMKINASALDGGEKNTTHPDMLISDNDGGGPACAAGITDNSVYETINWINCIIETC